MPTKTSILACSCLVALTGCPVVDLGDTPADIGLCNPAGGETYFNDAIVPRYLSVPAPLDPTHTCLDQGCHGGSFDSYRVAQAQLDCGRPTISPFLIKPLAGIEGHEGGDLFRESDPQYQVFLGWFSAP